MHEADAARLDALWQALAREAREFESRVRGWPVSQPTDRGALRAAIHARFDLTRGSDAAEVVERVAALLCDGIVHVTHPRYFGLFNPSVRPIGVAADALVSLYNPQLAVWSHAPAAVEMEQAALAALAHHSVLKSARSAGLGEHAVREVPVDDDLRMDVSALRTALEADVCADVAPLMIVGTAGTTASGTIDPLPALADLAAERVRCTRA